MFFVRQLVLAAIIVIAAAGCSQNKVESQGVPDEELNEKGMTPIESIKDDSAETALSEPASIAGFNADQPGPAADSGKADTVIADFENLPDNLGGEIGVFGSLESALEKAGQQPVSWVYEPASSNYSPENVHSGKNSFRIVNGLGIKPDYSWGSLSIDLGPAVDMTSIPKKVKSLDVSEYKYIAFWVKGAKGGENMALVARDGRAPSYSAQVKYNLPSATAEWQKVIIPLDDIKNNVDLTMLDNIGIAFGNDAGNVPGDIIYLDDFVLTNNP